MMQRLALLSVHGCPIARLGGKDSGGMNVYILQVARQLGKLGITVDVFTRAHSPEHLKVMELGDNARLVHIKAGAYSEPKNRLPKRIPDFLAGVLDYQKSEGIVYDILHSHYWLSGYAGLELCNAWEIPHVTTFHTLAKAKMRASPREVEPQVRVAAESMISGAVDAIVVSTDEERKDLCELYHVSKEKTRVISPGVDLDLFRPGNRDAARSALGLGSGNVLVTVGRMAPIKGFDLLLEAVARLKHHTDTRLIIIGGDKETDSEFNALRSLADRLGLSSRVTFVGPVEQTALPSYLAAADVFVMPSYHESFGLAALEAMACGLTVVASDTGGLKALISDGETGFLVANRSPEGFAERIDRLLSEPELRGRMGNSAHAYAQKLSWDITAKKLLALYESLVRHGALCCRQAAHAQ